ncbi:integrase [Methylohalomonas lacus]|uniref:Integrase n=1 Tax=Methylohalomonas lacus TaxID=398773 RepID=A0AAE3L0Q6_9GAMM|nr:integrase domain-containing protein [Methylohalomonas lacus]MCS3902934.1 integrase [Methylohalomonas lacus]
MKTNQLYQSMKGEATRKRVGRGSKTRTGYIFAAKHFTKVMQLQNIQCGRAGEVKNKHVRPYVDYCLENGLEVSTIRTTLSRIRGMCENVTITNKELGLDDVDYLGKHVAPSHDFIARCYDNIKDEGVKVLCTIQWYTGARNEELLLCVQSIDSWIVTLRLSGLIYMPHGTKGGKPRNIIIPHCFHEPLLNELWRAKEIMRLRGGYLLRGTNLDLSIKRYQDKMYRAGFKGVFSPHSLRSRFAQDLMADFERQGVPYKEAIALVSTSLGHGDGGDRCRWARNNYLIGWQGYGRHFHPKHHIKLLEKHYQRYGFIDEWAPR